MVTPHFSGCEDGASSAIALISTIASGATRDRASRGMRALGSVHLSAITGSRCGRRSKRVKRKVASGDDSWLGRDRCRKHSILRVTVPTHSSVTGAAQSRAALITKCVGPAALMRIFFSSHRGAKERPTCDLGYRSGSLPRPSRNQRGPTTAISESSQAS